MAVGRRAVAVGQPEVGAGRAAARRTGLEVNALERWLPQQALTKLKRSQRVPKGRGECLEAGRSVEKILTIDHAGAIGREWADAWEEAFGMQGKAGRV